ncbi:hypothetical protein BGZ67_008773 [Mortierella alpina]|nr:hypothetical protein BGZ67_008773 [Mortierella alpina]
MLRTAPQKGGTKADHFSTLIINGRIYAPCVPIHTSVDLWRVNYRFTPHSITVEQFTKAIEPYGIIADIGRYYYTIANNPCKVYTWDGYVILQGKVDKDGEPVNSVPVPEILDFGQRLFINTKTATDTPNSATNNTKADNAQPAPNVNIPKPQPRMKRHKCNGKKHNLKAVQQDNAMEGVISTNTTDDDYQQEAHRTGALTADNTAGTQSEASPTWLAEHAGTSAIDGRHHALVPHGYPTPDNIQDNVPATSTPNATSTPTPTIATRRQPRITSYAGSYGVAQLSQASIKPTNL